MSVQEQETNKFQPGHHLFWGGNHQMVMYIHERISLYSQDQKMAGFLINKKMDTSLESAFRDLHIDATTGALF